MVLLRELLGETLRRRRREQKRTLRDVSQKANVSLGYLSEIERGHKEPSSELLASVCAALQVRLSEVLAEVSHEVAAHERGEGGPGAERPVAVLPINRDERGAAEAARPDAEAPHRRRVPAAAPTSLARVRSRRHRGEVTDSVMRAAA
jgi:transcriptional regulator with XRE-family HTH domain